MSFEFENVSFEYHTQEGAVRALENISFKIEEGSFYSIVGETGSGKSTLLRLMNGLRKPKSGRVLLCGEDINSPSFDKKSLPFRVGLVFQYPEAQLFEETVLEEVAYGPMNKGLKKEEALDAAKKALADVEISPDKWEKSPFSLSGGEKRRVALASVLSMDCEILVLDEIAAGLDPKSHEAVFSLLMKMVRDGKTVVMVSHSMEDVVKYGERVLVLDKGHIRAEGRVRDIVMLPSVPKPRAEMMAEELRRLGMDLPSPILTMEELSREVAERTR
ncbi:MAG: ATP-binding cassette domain-containing protein [Candidatus Ornithospirochaeta sp.]